MTVLRDEIRAGVLVLVSVGVLTVGMLALAGSGTLFRDTKTVEAVFANARGLREGDPVRFAGMKVGTVDRLEIRAGKQDEPARITAALTLPGDLVVPADSRLSVTESLTGSRIVQITPGTGAPLAEGDALESLEEPKGIDDAFSRFDALADEVTKVVGKVGPLIDRVGGVVDRVDAGLKGEGLRAILKNLEDSSKDVVTAARGVREMVEENRRSVKEATESFAKVGAEASALIEETRPELREILARVKVAADGVARLFEGPDAPIPGVVKKIDVAAGKLSGVFDGFSDTGRESTSLIASIRPGVEAIIDRLKTTGTNLKAVSEDLRAHPWKLLNEPDEEDGRVQTLFNAARNFNSGAEALTEASRSLEALVGRDGADPAEIQKLVERLNRSFERYERVESLFFEALKDGKK